MSGIYSQTAELCLTEPASHAATVPDRLRSCVRNHTQHKIDAEFYSIWRDKRAMAQGLLDHIEGKRIDLIHVECSVRTGLLIGQLRAQGYKARDVIIISPKNTFPDHVLVEFWNEARGAWEAQDPTYNVHFLDTRSGERLSAQEIVAADVSEILPCRDDESCGWDRVTRENKPVASLLDYINAMAVRGADDEWQLHYDAGSFDPYSVNAGLSYCDQKEKFCKNEPEPVAEEGHEP